MKYIIGLRINKAAAVNNFDKPLEWRNKDNGCRTQKM
jgi:hypothetical protein